MFWVFGQTCLDGGVLREVVFVLWGILCCLFVCVWWWYIYIPFPTPSLFSNSVMFSIDLLGWEFGLCSFKQFQPFFFFKFCRLNLDLKCGLDHFQFQYFPLLRFKLIFLLLKTLIFFFFTWKRNCLMLTGDC